MNTKPLYYLASPYTHKDRSVMDQRFHAVMKAAVDLMLDGHYVFSPISYNAPMEIHDLPTDWGFWQDYDKAFIERCDALLVYTIDGHKESVGVNAEIEFANEIGKPVFFISPEEIQSGNFSTLTEFEKTHEENLKNTIGAFVIGEGT